MALSVLMAARAVTRADLVSSGVLKPWHAAYRHSGQEQSFVARRLPQREADMGLIGCEHPLLGSRGHRHNDWRGRSAAKNTALWRCRDVRAISRHFDIGWVCLRTALRPCERTHSPTAGALRDVEELKSKLSPIGRVSGRFLPRTHPAAPLLVRASLSPEVGTVRRAG